MSFNPDVEQKILQCVDEVLEALGESGRQAVHYYLERNNGLRREEIPQKPELFCKGLSLIFGEQGANVVGSWIVQKLVVSFGLKKKSNLTLAEVIDMIRTAQKKSC
jgi:hypothetical protein